MSALFALLVMLAVGAGPAAAGEVYPVRAATLRAHGSHNAVTSQALAQAQACFSQQQIQALVQSRRVLSLSQLIAPIQAAAGGAVLGYPSPLLCDVGGRLIYQVNVLTPNGDTIEVTVDAASGSILGY